MDSLVSSYKTFNACVSEPVASVRFGLCSLLQAAGLPFLGFNCKAGKYLFWFREIEKRMLMLLISRCIFQKQKPEQKTACIKGDKK
jgi:hypothetical protein